MLHRNARWYAILSVFTLVLNPLIALLIALCRDDQSMANISIKVPDTITSWSAAAYAVSSELGLGVAEAQEITVFQPFFLSMKLPYSVIRGEIVELPISVFNYVPGCMQVRVD